MIRGFRGFARFSVALAALSLHSGAVPVGAQYGYPVGYGNYGWGGGGGAAGTPQGDIARGMGVYAAGVGAYNEQSAVARSINADTVTRWNQYMYMSQMEANRNQRLRMAQRQNVKIETFDANQKRLRDNPTQRDIESGNALNVALDEINDPRVYGKTIRSATAKIGGEAIRDIPFSYGAAAISTSVHQVVQGGPPDSLKTEEFASERAELRALKDQIRKEIDEKGNPDDATIKKALATIAALQKKVDASPSLPRNSRNRVEADKYLKALHGLVAMLQTPAINVLLSGVEKRPDATLGELLTFMNAFNLRFGAATTPRQKQVYSMLYPELDKLRDSVVTALASTGNGNAPAASPEAPKEFFGEMRPEDLRKKAPLPPPPATGLDPK